MPPKDKTKKDGKGQQQTLNSMMTTQKKPSANPLEHHEP
jgi:hypothetical protein